MGLHGLDWRCHLGPDRTRVVAFPPEIADAVAMAHEGVDSVHLPDAIGHSLEILVHGIHAPAARIAKMDADRLADRAVAIVPEAAAFRARRPESHELGRNADGKADGMV